jgi:predicted dehydrogenase
MEAAVAVTPVPSHHSLSVYLSEHGVHNMVETTMASSLTQAREMVDVASEHDVVFRVAENFFRKPIDRLVQTMMDGGGLAGVRRIFSYNSHTGFHNNSRWIRFARDHPDWVQAFTHEMPTAEFHSTPQRFHDSESFRSHAFGFPDDVLVVDQASNVKGFLGRHPRPGYTEWQGERGTAVWRGLQTGVDDADIGGFDRDPRGEVRYASEAALEDGKGQADTRAAIETEMDGHDWIRTSVDLPTGAFAYENPLRLSELCDTEAEQAAIADVHFQPTYGVEVMGHLVDFALAVRGVREGEYGPEDALAAMQMEVGARESARRDGERIALPIEGTPAVDAAVHQDLRERFDADPLDVQDMLAIAYPRP